MSCPRAGEVEKTLSPAELRSFCDHARTCGDCGKLLDRVAGAYRVLRQDVPPLSPARRVELLARIEAEAEKPRFALRWALPLAAAAIAAIAIAIWPAKEDRDAPQLIHGSARVAGIAIAAGEYVDAKTRAVLEADTRMTFRGHVFDAEQQTALSFEPGPDLVAMQLEDGRVRFEVAPLNDAELFSVNTALARFEVIGTRFVLDVKSERVELSVEAGRVRVVPAGLAAVPRVVPAGEVAVIERAQEIAAAPPVPREETASVEPKLAPIESKRDAELEPKHDAKREPKRDAKLDAELEPKPLQHAIETKRDAKQIEHAVEPKPVEPLEEKPAEQRLDEARNIVALDAEKARDLAQGVLQEKPAPALEIGALLVLADAHRRTGEWREAASSYLKVADHQNGAPYGEEALLRRAQILAAQDLSTEALSSLSTAAKRFPRGALLPERSVLEARLHLGRSDPASAATAIERAGGDRTLAVLRARVEVAEALLASDPERARTIVTPVSGSNAPPDLIARARMIASSPSGNR